MLTRTRVETPRVDERDGTVDALSRNVDEHRGEKGGERRSEENDRGLANGEFGKGESRSASCSS